jgi:hypothetical protein
VIEDAAEVVAQEVEAIAAEDLDGGRGESGLQRTASLRCQRIGFSGLSFSAAVILRLAISS